MAQSTIHFTPLRIQTIGVRDETGWSDLIQPTDDEFSNALCILNDGGVPCFASLDDVSLQQNAAHVVTFTPGEHVLFAQFPGHLEPVWRAAAGQPELHPWQRAMGSQQGLRGALAGIIPTDKALPWLSAKTLKHRGDAGSGTILRVLRGWVDVQIEF